MNEGLDPGFLGTPEFARFLSEHFSAGSGDDIELEVQFDAAFEPQLGPGESASALDLHNALFRLTGNPIRPPIGCIGLLLGTSYSPESSAFGVMFDRGFATSDDPNGGFFRDVPREGAAVFLDTISAFRNPGGDDPESAHFENLFTAVHELGHVFNLPHDGASVPSFMSRSLKHSAFGAGAFHFNPSHAHHLGQCSVSDHVRPGESRFDPQGFGLNIPRKKSVVAHDLRLSARVGPQEAYSFEPIHLDVRLKLTDGDRKTIPAIMDPSHEGFRIFIEEPSGERRIYRASSHSCSFRPGTITLDRSHPYTRDIPIFCEGSTYTFRHPGLHRIRVEIDFGRYTVRSNSCELTIIAPDFKKRGSKRGLSLASLQNREVSKVLLHGRDDDGSVLRDLFNDIRKWPRKYSSRQSLLGYLVSKAAARSHKVVLQDAKKLVLSTLDRCLDADNLGAHRTVRARELFTRLSDS